MRFRETLGRNALFNCGLSGRLFRGLRFVAVAAGMAVTAAVHASGQNGSFPHNSSREVYRDLSNRLPSPTDLLDMQMENQAAGTPSYAAANAARRKLLSDESAKLLELAADLKLEMDKTSKDALSLTVIRKANEIEKLAKDVKEKMKLTGVRN
jgi:hypothetical protein